MTEKKPTKDLLKFLKPFPDEVRETALLLRRFVWDQYPESNELIYDNYNAVAIGWSPSEKVGDTFCSIAVGRSSYNVHFGFYWGSKISDPKQMLLGEGNQYRYILVNHYLEGFPKAYLKKLMKEAYKYSIGKMKTSSESGIRGAIITKSISPVKRKRPKKHGAVNKPSK